MKKVDFSDGRIAKDIFMTSLPILAAQILNLLYSIVDRMYIGRIPDIGTAALGAVGLCFPVIVIITAFTNMYGMGGSPLFAMALGEGRDKRAGELQNTAFRLIVVTSLAALVLCEFFGGRILLIFGATADELPMCLSYLRIYVLGTFFSMMTTGMNPYINAQGYAFNGMISVTIGAVANLVLDPLFIFAFGLGIRGAAIATVISQLLACTYVLYFLFRSGENEFVLTFKLEFPHAREIIVLGMSAFVMQITNSLVTIVCNNVLMRYGGSLYVSVMTIISSVRSMIDTPTLAIAYGASPVISYNYGAKKPRNVRKAATIMTIMVLSYNFTIWLLIFNFPGAFVRIFSSSEEIMEDASAALHLYFLAFVFQAFQSAGQGVFKSLGKKGYSIFFSVFRKVILVVPLTILLPGVFGLGTYGVFAAEPVSNVIGGLACFITMLITVPPELKKMRIETEKAGQ